MFNDFDVIWHEILKLKFKYINIFIFYMLDGKKYKNEIVSKNNGDYLIHYLTIINEYLLNYKSSDNPMIIHCQTSYPIGSKYQKTESILNFNLIREDVVLYKIEINYYKKMVKISDGDINSMVISAFF